MSGELNCRWIVRVRGLLEEAIQHIEHGSAPSAQVAHGLRDRLSTGSGRTSDLEESA